MLSEDQPVVRWENWPSFADIGAPVRPDADGQEQAAVPYAEQHCHQAHEKLHQREEDDSTRAHSLSITTRKIKEPGRGNAFPFDSKTN